MITGNEPAMPTDMTFGDDLGSIDIKNKIHTGLTIRQHFAAMAMQGMLANPEILRLGTPDTLIDIVTLASVEHADALIVELNKSD